MGQMITGIFLGCETPKNLTDELFEKWGLSKHGSSLKGVERVLAETRGMRNLVGVWVMSGDGRQGAT